MIEISTNGNSYHNSFNIYLGNSPEIHIGHIYLPKEIQKKGITTGILRIIREYAISVLHSEHCQFEFLQFFSKKRSYTLRKSRC